MLVEPLTTWLLVRISPVELTIMPVPAAALEPMVVLMSTIAGSTLAATAAALLLPLPLPVAGAVVWMGDAMGDACAVWLGLMARAMLKPMPAPAAAATTAIRTTNAAMRCHTEGAGAGGGAGIQAGGGPMPSGGAGGSGGCSGGVSENCPGSTGSSSVIFWTYLRDPEWPRKLGGASMDPWRSLGIRSTGRRW